MLTAQQVEQFQTNGFLNAGQVLDLADVEELSQDLNRIIEKGPDGFAPHETKPVLYRNLSGDPEKMVWQIVNIWEASPVFERLIHHPFIVRTIAQLTGFGDLQVWHDQVQYKPANYGGCTYWHQDAPLWPSVEPMSEVSAWIPFDDALEDNGCMWMVPGSHRWGNCRDYFGTDIVPQELPGFTQIGQKFTPPADAPIQDIKAVPCPVRRGEVHFHHALTWHGSPKNFSNRPRRAVAIHYMTSEAHFTGRDHPMRQFISIGVGESMRNAGAHFPIVATDGEPTPAPQHCCA